MSFRNQSCMATSCINKRKLLSLIFSSTVYKILSHYKKIGYNINVLRQTACLVVNPITVGNFAFLFNCTPAHLRLYDGSDLFVDERARGWYYVCGWDHQVLTGEFLLP